MVLCRPVCQPRRAFWLNLDQARMPRPYTRVCIFPESIYNQVSQHSNKGVQQITYAYHKLTIVNQHFN